jgi:hypothetical protein
MKCKIFHSTNGFINGKLGDTPIYLEDAIHDFLKKNKVKIVTHIAQSQSSSGMTHVSTYVTTTIFY